MLRDDICKIVATAAHLVTTSGQRNGSAGSTSAAQQPPHVPQDHRIGCRAASGHPDLPPTPRVGRPCEDHAAYSWHAESARPCRIKCVPSLGQDGVLMKACRFVGCWMLAIMPLTV
jgi:hypothetical protein